MVGRDAREGDKIVKTCGAFVSNSCVGLFLFLKLFNDNLNQLIWIVRQLFYALVNSIMRALRPFFQKKKAGPHSWTNTIVRRHVVGVFPSPEPLVELQR